MWWIEAILFSLPHPATGASFRLLSRHSPVLGHGPSGTLPAQRVPASPLTPLVPSPGLASFPLCTSRTGRSPPGSRLNSSPRMAAAAKLCWALERFGKQPWSRRGQRGWPGQHLKAAVGGAGFVQTNLSEERSAKALLNIWKLRLFTSEVYTLPRFGIFFFSGTVKGTSLTSDWPPCWFSWHCSKPHKH